MSGSGKACGEFVQTKVWIVEPSGPGRCDDATLPSGRRIANFLMGRSAGATISSDWRTIGFDHSKMRRLDHTPSQRGFVAVRRLDVERLAD